VLAKPAAPNNKGIARYEVRERRTLARTLDRELEPRVRPGRRGRPKGSRNYVWPPDFDKSLTELSKRCSPSVVKKMTVKLLLNSGLGSRGVQLKPDSLRKKIERRMDTLRLPTGTARKKQDKTAKPWTEQQTQTLLGMVGNDLTDKTIVERTEHTIKAARAKLRLLGYAASELRSVAYTVEELAEELQVTARTIRRWKEKGLLRTTRYRISELNLQEFIKEHAVLIPFSLLDWCKRVWLMGLGYPAPEAREFHAATKSILESVAGRKKRKDARADCPNSTPAPASLAGELNSIFSKLAKLASAAARWKREPDRPHTACRAPTGEGLLCLSGLGNAGVPTPG
jgi:hypothetical protein